MQRTEMVALVAGATVGMGGGTLGAFLVCTAGREVVHRIVDLLNDEYIDLGQPLHPKARYSARQASLAEASLPQPHSNHPPRTVPILS